MKLSLVIPVFRGGKTLKLLFSAIYSALIDNFDFEVLFICDGCDAGSYTVLKDLKQLNPDHIKIYYFTRNYGQHKAVQFGLGKAAGDFVVTMDEDMQHDPSDILKLLEKQSEGDYDVVYGRFPVLQHSCIRNKISGILRKVLKYYIPALYENYSPYRLIRREIAHKVAVVASSYPFIDDFISRATQNFSFVDINHHRRISGRSSYNLSRLFKHGVLIILTYSVIMHKLPATGVLLLFSGLVPVVLKSLFSINVFQDPFYYKIIPVAGLILLTAGLPAIIIKNLLNRGDTEPGQIL